MKKFTAKLVPLVAALAVAATSGCGDKVKEGGVKETPPVITGVTLEEITDLPVSDELIAVGTIKARTAASLASRIPGTVSAIHVREGDRVAKGKLLLTLDAAEALSGAAGAEAGVEEARRGVEEAQARKKLADTTYERYAKLLAERAVTKQEFDTRQTERDVASQGLARAEARLAQARESAKSAGTTAGYTKVTAPIAGMVTAKMVDVGATVFPGMPLLTVEEEGNYRLEVAAPESLLGKVAVGQPLKTQIDGITGDLSGKIAEVLPTVDPASRTFTVKVDIRAKGLRSGAYGKALFPVGERKGIMVPKVSVMERGTLTSVWVVNRDNVARMRLIKAGKEIGSRVEVLSGLAAGERVVIGGAEKVVDGAKIQ